MPISELNGLRTDTTTSYAGDMWNIINSLETKKVIGGIEMHSGGACLPESRGQLVPIETQSSSGCLLEPTWTTCVKNRQGLIANERDDGTGMGLWEQARYQQFNGEW